MQIKGGMLVFQTKQKKTCNTWLVCNLGRILWPGDKDRSIGPCTHLNCMSRNGNVIIALIVAN